VLLKIVYVLTCRVLSLAVLAFRGDLAKDAELLMLRHDNAVCAGMSAGYGTSRGDRVWFAALALDRNLPRDATDAPGLAPQAR
jgi:putative transposase